MRDFPPELIFILVFGFVWLVQFLLKFRGKTAAGTDAEAQAESSAWAEPEPEPEPEPEARAPARPPAKGALPKGALGTPGQPSLVPRRAAPVPAPVKRESRRFSRHALMADRRAVQNAFVIAAILGPCHAHRPYDID